MDDMKGKLSPSGLDDLLSEGLTSHSCLFFVDYFAMLDAAVRMQPMPAAYLTTKSNIYCQDCGKTGQVQYHFVGLKCSDCGSYNTREMGRVDCSDEVR
jgi:hypothetical protein